MIVIMMMMKIDDDEIEKLKEDSPSARAGL